MNQAVSHANLIRPAPETGRIQVMKALFLIGLALVLVGGALTFGPWSTGAGLLIMLCSLPPIFLGLFFWVLRDSDPQ